MALFSFPLLPCGYIHGFFFVFVFQFYIIHPVRSRVLYHSYSVNFDCYPFFLSRFSLFFFLFSSFSKMHRRCSCRGEEMLCLLSCSGWVLQLQAQVQLFFFFGIFVESWLKKMKRKESIKGSHVMNMWLFCQSVCREGRVFFNFFLCSWPTSYKTSRSSVDDMYTHIVSCVLLKDILHMWKQRC